MFARAICFLLLLVSSALAQQTQVQWGYLSGAPSQVQFKVGPTWFPIGTFDGVTFTPNGGGGSVTSVGLSMPAIFSVAGSPVTTTGTLAASLATQSANRFFAGPTGGGAVAPTFRAIVPADVPVMVGDSGAGGTAGLVPAPGAGDAAAGAFLSASGAFTVPSPTYLYADAVVLCGVDNSGVADVTAALNACITTYNAVGLRAGTYKTSACINVTSSQSLVGAGADATKIQINSTTESGVCVAAFAQKYMLKDFAVTRVGVPTNTAHGVNIGLGANIGLLYSVQTIGHYDGFVLGATANSLCAWCIAQQNYNNGFEFVNDAVTQIMQWSLVHTMAEKNDGWGYLMVAANGATNSIQGSPWLAPQSFANTAGGFAFLGVGTGVINDIALYNAVGSTDGNTEIFLGTNGGTNHQIIGGLFELAGTNLTGRTFTTPASNIGFGVQVTSGAGTVRVNGAQITTNSQDGINVGGAVDSLQIVGSTIVENGISAANTYSGIAIGASTSHLIVSGTHSGNITTANQKYGVLLNAASATSTMTGNIFSGATGNCFINGNMELDGNVGGTACGSPWIAYSPVATCQTGAPTTHTDTGAYLVKGRTVFLRGKIVITNPGTCGVGWYFPIPASTFAGDGASGGQETQATGVGLAVSWATGTTVLNVKKYDGTYIGAAGNTLTFSAVYEIP